MKTDSATSSYSKRRKMNKSKASALIFYSLLMIWPVGQFLLTYVYLNMDAFAMAFQKYDINTQQFLWTGLDNFKFIFSELKSNPVFTKGLLNGLLAYSVELLAMPVQMFMAYYIFSKQRWHKLFKIMLFMPSIISSLVITLAFKIFANNALPSMLYSLFGVSIMGLISNYHTALPTIIIWNTIYGLGSGMLIYLGTMNSVNESVIEYAKIDGASYMRTFISFIVPLIYPVIVVFFVAGFVGILTTDVGLYTYFGDLAPADLQTLGYYLFTRTRIASVAPNGETYYPNITAIGLLITFIILPLTFLLRYILLKVGPSKE